MAAPYYSLVSKTARALQCYVRAAGVEGLASANVFGHKEINAREFPNVTFRVNSASPSPGNPGRWEVGINCIVACSTTTNPNDADTDPILESDNLAGRVFDLFLQSIVGQDNSALADAITSAARAAVYTGDDHGLIKAARPFESLADFKCDYIRHQPGIDLNVNEQGSAYMDVLPLLLTVRTSTATET